MEELSAEAMLEAVSQDQAEKAPESTSEQVKAAVDPQTGQTYKYITTGGKEVEEPLEMILKRAGKGYHYAQQMHSLNQQMDEIKQIRERNKALSKWEQYDKYAQENQEWAKHVEDSWNNRTSLNQQQAPDLSNKFQSLEQKLAELERFREETLSAQTKQQYEAQDKTLASEIQKTSESFDVDFYQADEQGKSLEWRVLEHAQKIGFDLSKPGQFTAAFKDYYFDNLVGRQREQAKEQNSKEKAELKRAGIVDISRSPKANTSKGYRPGMSWNDLGDMALAEFNAAKGT